MASWFRFIALVSRGAATAARCCRQIGWGAVPHLIGLPAWPATGSPAEPAGRLDRAHAQLTQAFASADPQSCRDLRAEFERDPPQDWSHLAFLVWNGLTGCELLPGGSWTCTPPSAQAIRQAWQPAFGHFGRMPTELRLKNDQTVDLLVHYWATHRSFFSPALAASADAEEAAQLDDWHQRAAQTPPDPLAVASLTRLGQAVYGMRWLAGCAPGCATWWPRCGASTMPSPHAGCPASIRSGYALLRPAASTRQCSRARSAPGCASTATLSWATRATGPVLCAWGRPEAG